MRPRRPTWGHAGSVRIELPFGAFLERAPPDYYRNGPLPDLRSSSQQQQPSTRDLNWRPPQIRTPTTQPASALPGASGTATASPKQKQEAKKNRISPPHLVHGRAEGVCGRGPIFLIRNSLVSAPGPMGRFPGTTRRAQAPFPSTNPHRGRFASIFRARGGAKSRLNRLRPHRMRRRV